ncbi:hypothetical protein HKD24_03100 [Gluconobacter sp. LMG 31484]|uniref:Uncharacterized protein n=1 Tax=Gluconobacter vitians TaxID=2728102 RepID=A0ABR9Y318_9PROT|nr:hypothetical protein [Gluconobacter vitians]MBF0858200.1 hypothetical protein [Gluconobacter vitians]
MSGRTDTERLDWLECNGRDIWRYTSGFLVMTKKDIKPSDGMSGETLRAAIDAAMDAEERG